MGAELIAADSGLGWMIWQGMRYLHTDVIFVGVFTIGDHWRAHRLGLGAGLAVRGELGPSGKGCVMAVEPSAAGKSVQIRDVEQAFVSDRSTQHALAKVTLDIRPASSSASSARRVRQVDLAADRGGARHPDVGHASQSTRKRFEARVRTRASSFKSLTCSPG